MDFTVDFCKDEDFEAMMPVMFGAMAGRSQFVNAVYPHNLTPEGQKKHEQTFLYLKSIDPSQRWLKATDNSTGEMVGIAQWNVYDGAKPPEIELDGPPGTWDTDDDKEWAQAMFTAYMEDRRRIIREATGPVICMCVVDSPAVVGANSLWADLSYRPHDHDRGSSLPVSWSGYGSDQVGNRSCRRNRRRGMYRAAPA